MERAGFGGGRRQPTLQIPSATIAAEQISTRRERSFIETPYWTIYSLSHKISTLTAVQTNSVRLPVSTLLGNSGGTYRDPGLEVLLSRFYTVITARYQGVESQRYIPTSSASPAAVLHPVRYGKGGVWLSFL